MPSHPRCKAPCCDANGNRTSARIEQKGHPNDRSYLYDYDLLNRLKFAERGELNASGVAFGGGAPVDSEAPGAAPHFIFQDSNYNVVGVTNSAGALEQQYTYKPYGDRATAETYDGTDV